MKWEKSFCFWIPLSSQNRVIVSFAFVLLTVGKFIGYHKSPPCLGKSPGIRGLFGLCIGCFCPHESWNYGSIHFFSFISQGKVELAILSFPYVLPHPQNTFMCHLSLLERSLESMKDVNNGFAHFLFLFLCLVYFQKQILTSFHFSE